MLFNEARLDMPSRSRDDLIWALIASLAQSRAGRMRRIPVHPPTSKTAPGTQDKDAPANLLADIRFLRDCGIDPR